MRILLALSVCLLSPRAWGDAVADPESLIHRLARTAPASVGFVEVRYSSLLRAPIVVSGELTYLGPARLDRDVTAPYREHTAIRDESVSIEREGEQPRTLALRRAPELRGLLTGFSGVLAGDSAAVKRSFAIAAKGADDAAKQRELGNAGQGRARPDANARMHSSMTWLWCLAEFVPMVSGLRGKIRINLFRRRFVPAGALIHESVFRRTGYDRPLPKQRRIET